MVSVEESPLVNQRVSAIRPAVVLQVRQRFSPHHLLASLLLRPVTSQSDRMQLGAVCLPFLPFFAAT